MGSTENTATNIKRPRHSGAGRNPARQSEGLDPGLRRGDGIGKQTPYAPSSLSGSVGIGGMNAPDDVFQISSALASNGLMEAPQETADSTLYSGIISAQESMDSNLKRDGLVNPGGPTQQTFSKLNNQGFVKAPAHLPPLPKGEGRGVRSNSRKPIPGTMPVMPVDEANSADNAKLLERQNAKVRQQAKRDTAVDRIHTEAREKQARLQARQTAKLQRDQTNQQAQQQKVKQQEAVKAVKKLTKAVSERLNSIADAATPHPDLLPREKGRTQNPPLPLGEGRGEGSSNEKNLPPLSDETIQSNQRLADSLKTRTGVGDLPKFTSDAINTDGPKAIPEIVDLIREVEASDPKQARELYQRTFEGIAPENQQQLEENYMMYNSGGEDKEQDTNQPEADDIWSVPDQPMADGGASHVQPGNVEGPSDLADTNERDLDKVEWNEKPAFQHDEGSKDLKTKGPVQIRAQSVTPGIDGIDYEVDWLPLDKNGNVVPVWQNNDHKVVKNEIGVFMGQSKPSIHHPPFDNPHGFMVKIRIPPQRARNGNSSGVHLDVFTPKGGEVKSKPANE